jgi:primosomal protein N'
MFAEVVPILRLRRDTATWSYQIPANTVCKEGCLVEINFRGHLVLGIVWKIKDKDLKATQNIEAVLSTWPLLKRPQRRFVEYLSEYGLCSLSSALYQYLPKYFRQWPVNKKILADLKSIQLNPNKGEQTLVLSPRKNNSISNYFQNKFGSAFLDTFKLEESLAPWQKWLGISQAQIEVVMGRELALFAPWQNLTRIIILEPENIFYYHEQIPYLNLRKAAQELAKIYNAHVEIRTNLPTMALPILYNAAGIGLAKIKPCQIVDLKINPIINKDLVSKIEEVLQKNQKVLLYFPFQDRSLKLMSKGRRLTKIVPGVQALTKELSKALSNINLLDKVYLGSREILEDPPPNLGLVVVLSLDFMEYHQITSQKLMDWGDLGKLLALNKECLVQSHHLDTKLVQYLGNGQFDQYVLAEVMELKNLQLPPFGDQIVCSIEVQKLRSELVELSYQKILHLLLSIDSNWEVSTPFQAPWHQREFWHILLRSRNSSSRVPAKLRDLLISFPKPWKIQRSPEYLF